MTLLIELQYLPSIIVYKNLINASHVKFEQYELFQKMSFRNRCIIPTANGLVNLTVPIEGGRNSSAIVRDVKISNRTRWQHIHWRTIFSAYNRSPWFEFYREEMEKFYCRNFVFLWDWNLEVLNWTLDKLGRPVDLGFTEDYQPTGSLQQDTVDWRDMVLPKNYLEFSGKCPRYRQVFEEKQGFFPNLSIIDLLFCEGRNAVPMLGSS
jgi:hypothetical protein